MSTAHRTALRNTCAVTAHRCAVKNRACTFIVQFSGCAVRCAVRFYRNNSSACANITARLHFFLGKFSNMKIERKKVIEAGNTRARSHVQSSAFPAPPHPSAVLIVRRNACWWSVPDHCADYWGEDFRFPYGDQRRRVA